jgi:hypothetical protein
MNTVEASAATDLAWYVYGVVEAAATAPAVGGVEGDVALVQEGPVAALVSRVPLSEYGEQPVRARLEDPEWLEAKARAHDAVLEGALRSGPVVPFRLLTLYRNEAELRAFLAGRGADLRDVLQRVRGKVELGVKAFVDRARLAPALASQSEELRELDAAIDAAPPGKAYLLRRQREQAVAEQTTRLLRDWARASHARLSGAAEAAVSNPPQPRELSGRDEEMLLNGAYLVRLDDAALRAVVGALQDEYGTLGVRFELTGPWPPYNFVPRDLAANDA